MQQPHSCGLPTAPEAAAGDVTNTVPPELLDAYPLYMQQPWQHPRHEPRGMPQEVNAEQHLNPALQTGAHQAGLPAVQQHAQAGTKSDLGVSARGDAGVGKDAKTRRNRASGSAAQRRYRKRLKAERQQLEERAASLAARVKELEGNATTMEVLQRRIDELEMEAAAAGRKTTAPAAQSPVVECMKPMSEEEQSKSLDAMYVAFQEKVIKLQAVLESRSRGSTPSTSVGHQPDAGGATASATAPAGAAEGQDSDSDFLSALNEAVRLCMIIRKHESETGTAPRRPAIPTWATLAAHHITDQNQRACILRRYEEMQQALDRVYKERATLTEELSECLAALSCNPLKRAAPGATSGGDEAGAATAAAAAVPLARDGARMTECETVSLSLSTESKVTRLQLRLRASMEDERKIVLEFDFDVMRVMITPQQLAAMFVASFPTHPSAVSVAEVLLDAVSDEAEAATNSASPAAAANTNKWAGSDAGPQPGGGSSGPPACM